MISLSRLPTEISQGGVCTLNTAIKYTENGICQAMAEDRMSSNKIYIALINNFSHLTDLC